VQPGLVLEHASFRYGTIWVLLETSLHVSPGETLVVTGDNGVGKSTLLYLLAGLLPATTGRVLFDGHTPNVSRPSDLVRVGVRRGFVFQHGGLFANLTALDNVLLALRYHADVLQTSIPTSTDVETLEHAGARRGRARSRGAIAYRDLWNEVQTAALGRQIELSPDATAVEGTATSKRAVA